LKEFEEITDFSSPAVRPTNPYKTVQLFRPTSSEDTSDKWLIKPPIVTGARIPAVDKQDVASSQRQQEAGKKNSSTKENVVANPASEHPPLFEVNFMGSDQEWYTISAKRGRATAGSTPTAPRPSSWNSPSQNPTRPMSGGASAISPARITSITPLPPEPEEAEAPTSSRAGGHDETRSFLLQYIQPSLVGLMDGSVSTLAPIFAVAFATHNPLTTFLVGMASALGAGISMAFSEALSDDGELTGRGSALTRGAVTGVMTFLSGAGHALPFLISDIQIALLLSYAVVAIELFVIAGIRHKFFGTKWWLSIVQVVGGGLLVFLTALLLGNA
jgi:hypothetical protein